jgi:acyl carrier protein
MTDKEIIELLEEALEVSPNTLTPETAIADVEDWNSLGWLSVMSLLDERFEVGLSAAEIRAMRTVADVLQHVRAKTAAGA